MDRTNKGRAGACVALSIGLCLSLLVLLMLVSGCGSGVSIPATPANTTPPAASKGPLTYLAPLVEGATNAGSPLPGAQIFVLDDIANTFTQSTYQLNPPFQEGSQIINAGIIASGSRGLLDLGLTANYTFNGTSQYVATTYTPPQAGGFALELANRGGALVQPLGQPVEPLVPTSQCPAFTTAMPYRFLTIPGALIAPGQTPQLSTWNPLTDTAYGSVEVSTNGSTVTLDNIKQFTLTSVGGSSAPANPSSTSITGACGPTAYGNTISIPGQVIVPTPGVPAPTPAQAIVAIGQSGLLIEDNGGTLSQDGSGLVYQNALGAGTGAIGLPVPSAALDTAGLVGAQYLGFVYGAGNQSSISSATGWSSHLASFGFSSVPSSCTSVAAVSSTLVYGGDFNDDDPSTSSTGFGNCNLALNLGTQDSSNNGLYPSVTVSLGATYAGNTLNSTDSFPAIAIAGQLGGKYVLFVLGLDTTQPWAIYLLQSN